MRILDELATDFVIETCHKANQVANLSGRQKVKVDDFKFAIRGNEAMLGKVQELFSSERKIKVRWFPEFWCCCLGVLLCGCGWGVWVGDGEADEFLWG